MMPLFHTVSRSCSKIMASKYSTSFNSAIQLLHPAVRPHIFSIYGFVRLADEIVDSFHKNNKQELLEQCKQQTFYAIDTGISLNPILNSFQLTVNEFKIGKDLIHSFFESMELDLHHHTYNTEGYHKYIYGSAEVVGLMCLTVFCDGNTALYNQLKPGACALAAAFQKVNFLRDMKADYEILGRTYFPGVNFLHFTELDKNKIEADISHDFTAAYQSIRQLPASSRFAVTVAYRYYLSLFKKIKKTKATELIQKRVRVSNFGKFFIMLRTGLYNGVHFN